MKEGRGQTDRERKRERETIRKRRSFSDSRRRGRGLFTVTGNFSLPALIIHPRCPFPPFVRIPPFVVAHLQPWIKRGRRHVTNDSFDARSSAMGEILPRILARDSEDSSEMKSSNVGIKSPTSSWTSSRTRTRAVRLLDSSASFFSHETFGRPLSSPPSPIPQPLRASTRTYMYVRGDTSSPSRQ